MKQSTIPTIAIIITAIAVLLLFALSDHSGFALTDCSLQEDTNKPGTYNLTYNLLVGRHFNHVECQYILYSDKNQTIATGSNTLDHVNMGSFPINNNINLSEDTNVSRVDIVIYTRTVREVDGVNKTSMNKAYSKSFNF